MRTHSPNIFDDLWIWRIDKNRDKRNISKALAFGLANRCAQDSGKGLRSTSGLSPTRTRPEAGQMNSPDTAPKDNVFKLTANAIIKGTWPINRVNDPAKLRGHIEKQTANRMAKVIWFSHGYRRPDWRSLEDLEIVADYDETHPPVMAMKNLYEIRGDHVVIFLARHHNRPLECLVDINDFEKVSSLPGRWTLSWSEKQKTFYAISSVFEQVGGRTKRTPTAFMHRFILDAPKEMAVDHVDRISTLDNRRSNIRVASRRQNALNSKRAHATPVRDGWLVQITVFGKNHRLGTFTSRQEAELVRLGAALLADCLEAQRVGTISLAEHLELNGNNDRVFEAAL